MGLVGTGQVETVLVQMDICVDFLICAQNYPYSHLCISCARALSSSDAVSVRPRCLVYLSTVDAFYSAPGYNAQSLTTPKSARYEISCTKV